jgi:5-methylcytosine-specific restriction endonuclease McrA
MPTKAQIEATWERTPKVRGKDPDLYRRDSMGNEIYKPSYGKQSEKGWEVDHKNPKANDGTDHGRNLQALQWEANRKKSDKVN